MSGYEIDYADAMSTVSTINLCEHMGCPLTIGDIERQQGEWGYEELPFPVSGDDLAIKNLKGLT